MSTEAGEKPCISGASGRADSSTASQTSSFGPEQKEAKVPTSPAHSLSMASPFPTHEPSPSSPSTFTLFVPSLQRLKATGEIETRFALISFERREQRRSTLEPGCSDSKISKPSGPQFLTYKKGMRIKVICSQHGGKD